MRLVSQVTALSLLAGGVALHADTFRYDLNYDLAGVMTASATFTAPALITTDSTVAATGMSSDGSPVLSVAIYALGDCPFSSSEACFDIEEASDGQRLFLDSLPTAAGTYSDVFGDGTVVITDVADTAPSPVPEPSTLALLGTGVLGGLGAVRRRLA